MFNKVILVGNLTRDVELRYTPGGLAISKLGLATNRRYKNQQGEQKEEVCFVDINIFGRTAEVANQYLKKGSKVLIEGRLVLEQWTDQSGQKRSRHTVTAESMQMMDSKGSSGGSYNKDSYSDDYGYDSNSYSPPKNDDFGVPASPKPSAPNKKSDDFNIEDDDIPF
ncbi:MAG: single-stranded DNA-binding protein [Campylobacterales bacterium]